MLYYAKEKEAIFIMIRFQYTYLSLDLVDCDAISGFDVSFGTLDDWDDVVVAYLTRRRKFKDSVSYKVPKEWVKKVCDFIERQEQVRALSSWIYKKGSHSTEHFFSIESEGWLREITLYNLGEFGQHTHKNYEREEKILLEFFRKLQEFFLEVGLVLSFDKVHQCSTSSSAKK